MLCTVYSQAVAKVCSRAYRACGIVSRALQVARISTSPESYAAQSTLHKNDGEGVQVYDSADAASTALAEYNQRELCSAVYIIDEARVPASDLFNSIITEVIPRIEEFAADDLVQLSAIFHKHGVHEGDWYRAVSFHMIGRLSQLLPGGIATLMKVVSREDIIVADLFEACAKLVATGINQPIERQNTFSAEQQVSVAESCQAAGYSYGALAKALSGCMQKYPTAYTPEQARTIEAYVTQAGAADAAFRRAVASHGQLYLAHQAFLARSNQDDSPIYTLGQQQDMQQAVIRKAKVFLDDPTKASA